MLAPKGSLRGAVGMRTWVWALVVLAGCGDQWTFGNKEPAFDGDPARPPMDRRPVVRASRTPLPIYGGTLDVLDGGGTAVVSDPDRDQLYLVDLDAPVLRATIDLDDGDTPWRIAEDADGRVHVVLRGSGEVATVDPEAATLVDRRTACPNPRGITAVDDTLWVACAGGGVVSLSTTPDGSGARLSPADKDLRDVVAVGDTLLASRFRSSELLVLESGDTPPITGGPPPLSTAAVPIPARVAWRTRSAGSGWLMVHQYAVDVDAASLLPTVEYYGGPGPCDSPVTSAVTLFESDGVSRSTGQLAGVVAATDAALSPDGDFIMIASAGSSGSNLVTVGTDQLLPRLGRNRCRTPTSVDVEEPVVGVDFTTDGRIVAVLHEPAELLVIDGRRGERTRVPLASDSLADTGHQLFHLDAGPGLSCASCHPEGGDDGRVWQTNDGPRRTQPLDAGLAGTAPFHWNGEEADFAALIEETLVRRMGGRPQSPERAQAFEEWVMAIPDVAPVRSASDGAVQRGAASFVALGCVECHQGASTTQPDSIAFGGLDAIQVPMLLGVATRGPFMHDGRAATPARCGGRHGGADRGTASIRGRHRRRGRVSRVALRAIAELARCVGPAAAAGSCGEFGLQTRSR